MKTFINIIKSNIAFVVSSLILLVAGAVSFALSPISSIVLFAVAVVFMIINIISIVRNLPLTVDGREDSNVSKMLSPAMYVASTPFAIITSDDRVYWRNKAFTDIFNISVGASVAIGNISDPATTSLSASAVSTSARTLSDISINFNRLKAEGTFYIDFKGRRYKSYSFPCGLNGKYRALLFSDCTEIKDKYEEFENASIVVTFIQIDNGAEIRESHSQFAQTAATIEVFLQQWTKDHNGFITKDESGMFIIQFEKKYMNSIIETKFEVLDDIVSLSVGEELPLTVSIGVSSANGTLQQKCDEAKKSLNKAYESGGAKAVVAVGDGTYDEYGGKHKPFQSQSATRARICKDRLKSAIEKCSNVLIFGHKRPDFDSIASCIGLARFVQIISGGKKSVKIVIDENEVSIEYLIRYLYEELGRGAKEFENLFVNISTGLEENYDNTLLIVSDVSNPDLFESSALFKLVNTKFVIDHHSLNHELNVTYKYIDPSASSASEMVCEMLELELSQMQLGASTATMLLSGILVDTNMFKHDTGPRTFAACRYLCKEGSDFRTASYWLNEEREEFSDYEKFDTADEGVYMCVITKCYDPDNKVMASKLSDSLMMTPGYNAVFTLYNDESGISLSARSYKGYNVKNVAVKLGGGGHFQAAGATLKTTDDEGNSYIVTDMEEAKKMVLAAIKAFKENGHE